MRPAQSLLSSDISNEIEQAPSTMSLLDIAASVELPQQQIEERPRRSSEVDDLETRGPKVWEPLVLWEGENGPTVVEPILANVASSSRGCSISCGVRLVFEIDGCGLYFG